MKRIEFTDERAMSIYTDYMVRVERMTKILPKEDQNEILMELNSHIYEAVLQGSSKDTELNKLVDVITRLGAPEKTLAQLVADKKMNQALHTFNPVHLIKALALNVSNGIVYVAFFILYLLLAVSSLLIVLKCIYPQNTGIFLHNGYLSAIGFIGNSAQGNLTEIAGWAFIPMVVAYLLICYFALTLLLKLRRKRTASTKTHAMQWTD